MNNFHTTKNMTTQKNKWQEYTSALQNELTTTRDAVDELVEAVEAYNKERSFNALVALIEAKNKAKLLGNKTGGQND